MLDTGGRPLWVECPRLLAASTPSTRSIGQRRASQGVASSRTAALPRRPQPNPIHGGVDQTTAKFSGCHGLANPPKPSLKLLRLGGRFILILLSDPRSLSDAPQFCLQERSCSRVSHLGLLGRCWIAELTHKKRLGSRQEALSLPMFFSQELPSLDMELVALLSGADSMALRANAVIVMAGRPFEKLKRWAASWLHLRW
uniref:Uncharacterized protein n=1 Tax=Tetraselmis sp. GSL018 TaxID=582737 RepID=A0A061SI64_9CHLO